MYHIPSMPKFFHCKDCNKEVECLRWKEISSSINKGSTYKCDNCWVNFDKDFDDFCLKSKLKMVNC